MSIEPRNDEMTARLKSAKSAFILEAVACRDRGLDSAAMALFLRAAEIELELAEHFRPRRDKRDYWISLLSAGSCFLSARQYARARSALRRVAKHFPEARQWIAECGGKPDAPMVAGTPGLQALIELLVKKGVIQEGEWADAMGVR